MFEYVTPAPVIEYIVLPPAMTSYAASCQQLPPAYTMTAVDTDVNFDTTGLVHPQFSFTAVEAFSPQVVGSLPPLDKFVAPVYNQIHQEQIVAGETTQRTFGFPAVQEQVVFQAIPQTPQVVDSFPRLGDVAAREYNQVHQEQLVATIQPPVIFEEIPEVQVVERIQEQIVETIEVVPQERATQRTSEQIEVHELHVDQCVDRGHSYSSGRGRDRRHVGSAEHPHDQRVHALAQTQQRKGGQTRGGVLEYSLEVTGIDQVVWVPTRCTTSAK